MTGWAMPGFERLTRQLVAALEAHLAGGGLPEVPEAGRLLWRLFLELHEVRTSGVSGRPDPLSYTEVASYARVTGWPLQRHHVAALRAMDAAWMAWARSSAPGHGDRTIGELTPELFDAWLGG